MGKKQLNVSQMIKLMHEKQVLTRMRRKIEPVDLTRIEAWGRIQRRLRKLEPEQKTISEKRAKAMVRDVVFREMHLIKSPFKEI